MDFEKLSDRLKGFLQSAQTLAVREGNPQITPEHLLKVLLDDPEGLAAGLISRAGGDAKQALDKTEAALAKLPKVSGGGATQPHMAAALARVLDQAEQMATKAGDSFVTVERVLQALAMSKEADASRILDRSGLTPQNLNAAINDLRKGRTADFGRRRAGLRCAQALHPRLHRGRGQGQARPGDRPRRGDQAHHPGAVAPHQEQSGADRRARRRQDRHRRGPGAPHRAGRRAGEPQGQEGAVARPWLADRRRQISRRVRGAAEIGAERDRGGAGPDHSVHRRDAYAGRRRQGRRRHGRLQPAETGAGPRRAALRRRHHARRISQTCREGRGARPALPAGVRAGAVGRGHHLDPARAEGEIRAASRRAHLRCRLGRRRHALQPLHLRPLPARQGDRPGRRGRLAPAHAGRFQARGARRARPPHHAAQDRARGAEEGEGHRVQGPAGQAREGDRQSRGAGEHAVLPLAGGEIQARLRAEAERAARRRPHRAGAGAAARRSGPRRRARLRRHPRSRGQAQDSSKRTRARAARWRRKWSPPT